MKKGALIYLSCIIFLAIASFIIVLILRKNSLTISENRDLNYKYINEMYYFFKNKNKTTIQNNGIKINSEILITDENMKYVSIEELFKDQCSTFKVIIRTSSLGCDICLTEELKNLDEYIHKIGAENLYIFASDYNQRSLEILRKNISYNIQVYQVSKINIPFEETSNSLFVFILDKDMIIKDFFVPEKTLPDFSKDYYKVICNKYLQIE